MVEQENTTQKYIESLREQAKRLDNDRYLLKLADAVEKNKGVTSATIELAVASRIQVFNTNQVFAEEISKMNEVIAGLVQYQQRCTDLAISAFGIPEDAVNPEKPKEEGEPELQLEDDIQETSEPEVESEPQEPRTEVPPEPSPPKPKKTGKVPDFKVKG